MRAIALALIAAAACSSRGDPVARSVASGFERELGVRPRAVRCRPQACTLILPDGTELAVQLTGAGRDVTWETEEVIDPRPIVARISDELTGLGAAQPVDCGALRPARAAPVTIECQLGGGGAAWATIDPAGEVDVELALTAASAEARRTGPGDAALEAQSRALDSDEAQGVAADPATDDDDDDEAAADAGVDSAVLRGLGG